MNIKSIGDEKYVEHFVIAFDTAHLLFNFMSNLFIFVIQLLVLIPFFVPLGIDRGPKGRHAIFHGFSV